MVASSLLVSASWPDREEYVVVRSDIAFAFDCAKEFVSCVWRYQTSSPPRVAETKGQL